MSKVFIEVQKYDITETGKNILLPQNDIKIHEEDYIQVLPFKIGEKVEISDDGKIWNKVDFAVATTEDCNNNIRKIEKQKLTPKQAEKKLKELGFDVEIGEE